MKNNILLILLSLFSFILFAIGVVQSNNSIWMIIGLLSFVSFLFLIYRLVSLNLKQK